MSGTQQLYRGRGNRSVANTPHPAQPLGKRLSDEKLSATIQSAVDCQERLQLAQTTATDYLTGVLDHYDIAPRRQEAVSKACFPILAQLEQSSHKLLASQLVFNPQDDAPTRAALREQAVNVIQGSVRLRKAYQDFGETVDHALHRYRYLQEATYNTREQELDELKNELYSDEIQVTSVFAPYRSQFTEAQQQWLRQQLQDSDNETKQATSKVERWIAKLETTEPNKAVEQIVQQKDNKFAPCEAAFQRNAHVLIDALYELAEQETSAARNSYYEIVASYRRHPQLRQADEIFAGMVQEAAAHQQRVEDYRRESADLPIPPRISGNDVLTHTKRVIVRLSAIQSQAEQLKQVAQHIFSDQLAPPSTTSSLAETLHSRR